jgi:hypothetical protein
MSQLIVHGTLASVPQSHVNNGMSVRPEAIMRNESATMRKVSLVQK